MGKMPSNIRLAQLLDARNTLNTIYQRNNSGFSDPRQSLNDLFTIEYMSKKLGLSCSRDVSQIRKATQDYFNGRLRDGSYSSILRHYGKKAKISIPALEKENKVEMGMVFGQNKRNNSNGRKLFTTSSMNQLFTTPVLHRVQKQKKIGLETVFGKRKKLTKSSLVFRNKPRKNIRLDSIFQSNKKRQTKTKIGLKSIFKGM